MAPSNSSSAGPKPLSISRPIPPERIVLFFAALEKMEITFPAPWKTMSDLSDGKVTDGALAKQFQETKKIAKDLADRKVKYEGGMANMAGPRGKKRAAAEAEDEEEGVAAMSKNTKKAKSSKKPTKTNGKKKQNTKKDTKGAEAESDDDSNSEVGDIVVIKRASSDEEGVDIGGN